MSQLPNYYQHWKLDQDKDAILWLTLDKAESSANTLGQEVMDEFDKILDLLQDSPAKALIIRSGKKSGFIFGADINEIAQFQQFDDFVKVLRKGQMLYERLENLEIPTVAMIKGLCLGGGLELSLACDYRVAEDGLDTNLAFPEVRIGIFPAWGGLARLPRLIGAVKAMDVILSGRMISANAAYRMGFVDAAVPRRQLESAATYYALKQPKKHKASFVEKLTNYPWVRPLLAYILTRKVAKKVNFKHYPAPKVAIDHWAKNGISDYAIIQEAQDCAELLMGDTAKNLLRVFALQEKVKRMAKNSAYKFKHVHVIGAGTMGGDIAAWCTLRGYQVTLQDREPKYIAPAIKRAYALFKKKLKEDHLVLAAMDRLMPDIHGIGIAKADIIIEAVFEDVDIKKAVWKDVEAKAKVDAILTTNTSTIPLDEISCVLHKPDRLVGLHFFNPVAKMPLVEVVETPRTNTVAIAKALAFVKQIGKLPLPVKSLPGFLVNRALVPYFIEAFMMHEEGVPAAAIDKAATDFGMPMGPMELADIVGLDVTLAAANTLAKEYNAPPPRELQSLVDAGNLGKKTGKGFYTYKNGQLIDKKVPKDYHIVNHVGARLIYRMLNQLAGCLREHVVENTDLLDFGMIFGSGFAPFRGGPMHYAQHQGKTTVLQQLAELQQTYGERFAPDPGWEMVFSKQAMQQAKQTEGVS